jgi:peptidoglycan/xylan/chitin deacetylase (PgdA/CDA1 family)
MTKLSLILTLLWSSWVVAQEAPLPAPTPAPPVAEIPAVPDDGIRVSIIGYHDLGETLPETAMRIRTSKFAKQMEAIHQLGIKVISMEDFISWKKNGTKIPDKCLLITFDDGWKTVYTEAFPILKKYGFPYTLYLYKDYVDGGGRALTTAMIQEMKAAGGLTIGCHSVSHPYPLTVKSYQKKGPDIYDAYLKKEMGDSKTFLETKFGEKVTTYAFPGGYYTEEMLKVGHEFGYDCMFTVIPGKVKRPLPDNTLPRYIILGNYDKIFETATTFREGSSPLAASGISTDTTQTTPCPVTPEAGALINSRLPEISADLTKLEGIDPKTLTMRVSGFGEVPATYDPVAHKLSWHVNRSLRLPTCQVVIDWKNAAGKPAEAPLRWTFQIDLEAAYLPESE